ncbi:TetR/AcrR family transcriptional regulator [Streptomyces lutosisoli]|uniref:TetR/AcrR family transcriptional regulator n=1 Tax=Streptomyces lutosisoli TaxID=2665721 RepID=A0ABW2VW01_9ACTN
MKETKATTDTAGARARIIEAACSHIARNGLEGAKIRDIAHDAGVSTALVHYHFATKATLLDAALVHAYDRAGTLRLSATPGSRSHATQRLADLITFSLPADTGLREEWLLWMELWLHAVRDPSLRTTVESLYGKMREEFTAAVTDGVAAGEFTCPDPDVTVTRILALLDGFGLQAMLLGTPEALTASQSSVGDLVGRELGLTGPLPFRPPASRQ